MVFLMPWRQRVLAAAAALTAATVAALGFAAVASAGVTANDKLVTYRGYTFEVPRDWPVLQLAANPSTCVRFDEHAVYLGQPGPDQACPAKLYGATEALLVQPAAATAPTRATADPVGRQITVSAPGIQVTASYDTDRAEVVRILGSARLPRPVDSDVAYQAYSQPHPVQGVSLDATNVTGYGFDACAAPSSQVMQAWLSHSKYRAVGVYIGGSDRGCAQPNLTAAWVSQQAAAGWHFIPLYVGPQVAFKQVTVATAATQAVSAAEDAAVQADNLGFRPGTPIYYDMEAYKPSGALAALTFLSAWSAELHKLGFRSAVYSSSDSGVSDLVAKYTAGTYTMPDAIYDAWWNGVADTADPNIPATDWANHQRVHQYAGDLTQRHGGYQLSIDKDYLDVQFSGGTSTGGGGGGGWAPASPTRQASQAVETAHGGVDAFFRGADGALWAATYHPGTGWTGPTDLGGSLASQPSAVGGGNGQVSVFYRGTDGGLWGVKSTSGGAWSAPQPMSKGRLGGGPVAVSTQNGEIAVFWRGTGTARLWAALYSPKTGWQPQHMVAAGIESTPAPEVSAGNRVGVFWQGSYGTLWHTSLRGGSHWRIPAVLPVGRLGSAPHATGLGNGQVQVVWGGTSRDSIWHALDTPSGGWARQRLLALHRHSNPVAVASSTSAVLWVGRNAKLWFARGSGFSDILPAPVGRVGSGLFAAGAVNGVVDVFWTGSGGHLWHTRYQPGSSGWTAPADLGGHVS